MKRMKFCKVRYLSALITIIFHSQSFGNNDTFYPVTFDANGKKTALVFGVFSKSGSDSESNSNSDENNNLSVNTKSNASPGMLNSPRYLNQNTNSEQNSEIDVASLSGYQQIPTLKNTGPAGNYGNVDIRSIVDMAISWHPAIKRSGREVERAKEAIEEANSAYYPSLNMGVKTGLEQNDYGNGNDRSNKITVAAEQMIYDFGKTKTKVSLNELNTVYSEYELEKEINDIAYQTVNAYLQVVKYKQLIEIADEQLSGFAKINEIAKK